MKKPDIEETKLIPIHPKDHSFFIGEVAEVTLSKRRRRKAPYFVSIWGPDDIGYHLEYTTLDEARRVFRSIQAPITSELISQLGLKPGF